MFNYYPCVYPQPYVYYFYYPCFPSTTPEPIQIIPSTTPINHNPQQVEICNEVINSKDRKISQNSTNSNSQPAYKRSYQVGKKILRNFLNESLRRILNTFLKEEKSDIVRYLKKFKPATVYNLNTKKIKNIMSKTIREIFEMDGDAENLKVLNVHAANNEKFQSFVSLPFEDAFVYYLGSEEFLINKNKLTGKYDNEYVMEYDYYARNFLERYKNKVPNKNGKECN